jgi:hypothetical protein
MLGVYFWKYFDEPMRKPYNDLTVSEIHSHQSVIISSDFKFFAHQFLIKNQGFKL